MNLLDFWHGITGTSAPVPRPPAAPTWDQVIVIPPIAPAGEWPAVSEFAAIYAQAAIAPAQANVVELIVSCIVRRRAAYETVAFATGVPWWWVGCIHNLEASLRFDCHLHNGDPLSARTTHVPAGRPSVGQPPFLWTESATDALNMRHFPVGLRWTLQAALDEAERYNGLGYRNRGVRTPYLWAATTAEQPGRFVADGKFDPAAVSKQVGVAALLKSLAARGVVTFDVEAACLTT